MYYIVQCCLNATRNKNKTFTTFHNTKSTHKYGKFYIVRIVQGFSRV